jgi:hypothetical protein
VTGLAGFVSGEVDGTGGDLGNGGATVMPVLAETLGHHEVANNEEDHKRDDEEKREAEKMS